MSWISTRGAWLTYPPVWRSPTIVAVAGVPVVARWAVAYWPVSCWRICYMAASP
ncbi:hypothetical protein GA0070563_11962 [Micromonospora carbonacea]|uniref:Uncharacterized protein n=1 Tax=Micromonospora carbonacea TaxID=47853 RepID=A0A1C5ATT1_9ACTN|nr:hypothetical protein GA0070563_11962 [Micromonospora carbonacea]